MCPAKCETCPLVACSEDKRHDSHLQTRKLRFRGMMHICPNRKVQGWGSNLHPDFSPDSFLFSNIKAQVNAVWPSHALHSLSCCCLSPEAQADAVDADLAAGQLESWPQASIVSAFITWSWGGGWDGGCFSWELRQGRRVSPPAGTQARRTRELGASQSSMPPLPPAKLLGASSCGIARQARLAVGWGVDGVRDVQEWQE